MLNSKDHMNTALITAHIWSILSRRESLWVEWVYDHKLKGRNFWDVPMRNNTSWSWRKILQLRPSIRQFICTKLGDGKQTSVWFDQWSDVGPLANFVHPSDIRRAGFWLDSKVSDLNAQGQWLWPAAWLDLFPVLNNIPAVMLDANKTDELVWKVDNIEQHFSSSVVWHAIRRRELSVPWVHSVWFSHCIPKHAFNMWLVMRGKLLTQDKILQWSPARRKTMNMMCCPLCIADFDSHEHLFFECNYSSQVWFKLQEVAHMQHVPPIWQAITAHLIPRGKSKRFVDVVGRLIVAAATYYIWQERNNRLFANHARPPDILIKCILATVRLRLMKLKFKQSASIMNLLEAWGIQGDRYIMMETT